MVSAKFNMLSLFYISRYFISSFYLELKVLEIYAKNISKINQDAQSAFRSFAKLIHS